jgi:hypothetical protein
MTISQLPSILELLIQRLRGVPEPLNKADTVAGEMNSDYEAS